MTIDYTVARRPANPVPRHLRDRSKYNPHQSVREAMRRVGQLLRGSIQGEAPSEAVQAFYFDYATSKAARQDLSRFRLNRAAVDEAKAEIKGLLDDHPDVTFLPETGPDPA